MADVTPSRRKHIEIDAPGAGAWIMARSVHDFRAFTPETDHSLSVHLADGTIIGGYALCDYTGSSLWVHMAADDTAAASRDIVWMLCHYCFEQLGCSRIFAHVRSTNERALAIDLRFGFHLEARLPRAYPDGDGLILAMDKADCRWLRMRPRDWQAGH